jgi:hypothetical protein
VADPKQPDKTAPPPERPPHLIAIRKVVFRQGENVPIPGKSLGGTNALEAKPPTTSEFYTIDWDQRARMIVIRRYKAGPKLDRRHDEELLVPESWGCMVVAVPAPVQAVRAA